MPLYRKKPVTIEAMPWTGEMTSELVKFLSDCNYIQNDLDLKIATLEGVHTASLGDYIIKGVKGEYYPCKPDIFDMTYDPISCQPAV